MLLPAVKSACVKEFLNKLLDEPKSAIFITYFPLILAIKMFAGLISL
jgi:hypothetical protein